MHNGVPCVVYSKKGSSKPEYVKAGVGCGVSKAQQVTVLSGTDSLLRMRVTGMKDLPDSLPKSLRRLEQKAPLLARDTALHQLHRWQSISRSCYSASGKALACPKVSIRRRQVGWRPLRKLLYTYKVRQF